MNLAKIDAYQKCSELSVNRMCIAHCASCWRVEMNTEIVDVDSSIQIRTFGYR